MYRYSVDNAVTYTSEDFVLFRESPFACWMERLNLENPDHGIPSDIGSLPPVDSIERQDDLADTLRSEGKNVFLVDWEADEPERRRVTLDAMRNGADFIVNGQLALGPLASAANLLVRSSGYSELGDFLYIPCDTQSRGGTQSSFRLCFLADLLHSLQGQLPPQMLMIRGGEDLVPLETEDHIYHYRAVKQRFMEAMRSFRKHRMPDPVESSHFGRWSDCAHEVLKQRLLRDEQPEEEITDEDYQVAVPKAATVVAGADGTLDLHAAREPAPAVEQPTRQAIEVHDMNTSSSPAASNFTLAEQAHNLAPGTYKPGPGVYRLGQPRTAIAPAEIDAPAGAVADTTPAPDNEQVAAPLESTESAQAYDADAEQRERESLERDMQEATRAEIETLTAEKSAVSETQPHNRRSSDKALQNLQFIGSSPRASDVMLDKARKPNMGTPPPEILNDASSSAPSPSLREPRKPTVAPMDTSAPSASLAPPPADIWLTVDDSEAPTEGAPSDSLSTGQPDPLVEPTQPISVSHSAIDLDSTHPPSPPTTLTTSEGVVEESPDLEIQLEEEEITHGFGQAATDTHTGRRRADIDRSLDETQADDPFFDKPEPGLRGFSDSLITSEDYEE
ncbi:MAG: hypothetical protein AAGI44_18700 [Pseudomonadota bacterium]